MVDKDEFIWQIITKEQAIKIFNNDIFPVFTLDTEGIESEVMSVEDINNHEGLFGLEVGYLNQLILPMND